MKSVTKFILGFVIALLLWSCAMRHPVLSHKTEFAIDQDQDAVIAVLANQAKSCWAKPYSFFGGDAQVVEHAYYGITVGRWAPDLNYVSTQPYFRLRVMKDGINSVVYTNEVECDDWCLSFDVKRWLDGDLRCKLPK